VEPFVSWVCGVHIFHDATHFALSPYPWVNSVAANLFPEFSSTLDWYVQHNIGHHGSTNEVGADPDLYHAVGLQRSHESIRWRPLHQWGRNVGWLTWSVGVHIGLLFTNPIKMVWTNSYNRCVPLCREYLCPTDWVQWVGTKLLFLGVYVGVPLYHFGPLMGVVVIFVSRGIYSLLFMVHSQVSHLQTSCMVGSTDWYTHQVQTSTNHGCDRWWETFLSGGINYHIEHHLFPSVNHCHYPALRAIVRATCRKHDIEYKEFVSHEKALRAHAEYLSR